MKHNLIPLGAIVLASICFPSPARPTAQLRIEPGTRIPVRLERSVGTKDFYKWKSFGEVRTVPGVLVQDLVTPDGQVALEAGTRIQVAVLENKRAGHVVGRSKLRLGLYSLVTPRGRLVPLDGYPTDINHRKVDKEGTARGHRGLVKDAAVDFGSVTTGAGVGFAVGGPIGAAMGAGGGLLIATIWTAARRGPDFVVPAGTVVEFVVGRPVSVEGTGDTVEAGGTRLEASTWGRGTVIPPSEQLLRLADQLPDDPQGVQQQLKGMRFRESSGVDRAFAKYLQAVARFQTGDHSQDTLKLMREAYREGQASALPESARIEMARNLVVIMRGTESNWERDPVLNDPRVQAALVEEIQ